MTPTITWRKDGADLDLSDSRFIQTQDRLTISALRKDADEGTYQCVVSNTYGTIFSTEAELKFACKCPIPKQFCEMVINGIYMQSEILVVMRKI